MPTLYIFAGLPGVGKSTLAHRLAEDQKAVYLRIDTIEQGLRELCHINVEGEGYRLAYRIAADNLKAGTDVIADSCNPVELTRREWEAVAISCNAQFRNIEVICSDSTEHRRRVESRVADIAGLQPPDWNAVENRIYDRWSTQRVTVDTAGASMQTSFASLLQQLEISKAAT